jgi:hypothetical protein
MSCLQEQQAFCAWLEGGDEPLPGIDRARLAVHRNTYVGTLVSALAESFPVTRALAGADFFDAMARERVRAEPPRSPVLFEYARSFPRFVAAFAPAATVPVLAEMAHLEALRLRAFHAADADALAPGDFHRLARDAGLLERSWVRLHPAAHWLPAGHQLLELWRVHDAAEDMHALDLRGLDFGGAQDLLVHRPRFEVRMRALPPGAIALLDALANGRSLAGAFAAASATSPAVEPAVLFGLLLHEGLVCELIESPPEPANP